jgi:hypothetical protein
MTLSVKWEGKGALCCSIPHKNCRKEKATIYVNSLWNVERVHRMYCILFTVCLRNLFIYSASTFLRYCCCQSLIRHSFTWYIHMVSVLHHLSCAHVLGEMTPITAQNCVLNDSLLWILHILLSWAFAQCEKCSQITPTSVSCFVLEHSWWHKSQTLYFLC